MLKAKMKSQITLKFKGTCQQCGKRGTIKIVAGCYYRAYGKNTNHKGKPIAFEIHHIVSIIKGGKHSEANLTLVCRKCHRSIIHRRNNK